MTNQQNTIKWNKSNNILIAQKIVQKDLFMLQDIREKVKNNLSHQNIKTIRTLIQNISYPPFIYSQFAKQLVLILGCQRSGNTLAYLMLNCHPNIQGIDESDSNYKFPNALKLYSQQKKNSRILLKFPNQTYNLEYFSHHLPQTKIIWPIRNPYAVVSSMRQWQQKEGNWIKVYAQGELWQHSFLFPEILNLDLANLDEISLGAYIWKYKERTLQLYKQNNFDVFTFQYEQLLDNPRLMMSNIIEFLGLDWSENVLHHEQYYNSDKRYPGGTKGSNALDQSRKQPKLSLSQAEIALITDICGAEMQPYFYSYQS